MKNSKAKKCNKRQIKNMIKKEVIKITKNWRNRIKLCKTEGKTEKLIFKIGIRNEIDIKANFRNQKIFIKKRTS